MIGISLFGMNQSTKFGKDYTLSLRKNKEKLQKIFLHNPIPRNGYLMILHIAYLRPSAKEENSKVVRPRFLISPRHFTFS